MTASAWGVACLRVLVCALLVALYSPLFAQRPGSLRDRSEFAKTLAPYVPSPQAVVDRMLDAAELKPGETLYDLGCGDGIVLITAARRFGAKAVGVELSKKLVDAAQERIRALNLQERVKVIHGDLMNVNLEPADVVTVYLETASNDLLRPKLEKYLKPGARVVSHDFEIRGWKPVKVERIPAYHRDHMIYVYRMPPRK